MEIIAPSKIWFGDGWLPEPRPAKTSIRFPFGSTATWLPIVTMFELVIATGVDHVLPP